MFCSVGDTSGLSPSPQVMNVKAAVMDERYMLANERRGRRNGSRIERRSRRTMYML